MGPCELKLGPIRCARCGHEVKAKAVRFDDYFGEYIVAIGCHGEFESVALRAVVGDGRMIQSMIAQITTAFDQP